MAIGYKYIRPYCKDCKLIWGVPSIGIILNCPKCGNALILKSFNPWPRLVGGLGIICAGGLTLLIKEIPIIWIGGFLFGAYLIFNSFRHWLKIKDLDLKRTKKKQEKYQKIDANHVLITCGKCSQKLRVPKSKGTVRIKCPNCQSESSVTT